MKTLSRDDIIDFLFVQGLTTAKEITDISGRGVGMDVVKQNIPKAGGKICVETKEGEGTTFILRLPKNVGTQIVNGILIRVGSEHFVIQAGKIFELFSNNDGVVRITRNAWCIKFRGKMVSYYRLDRLLQNARCKQDVDRYGAETQEPYLWNWC